MALLKIINQRTIYTTMFFVLVVTLLIVWKPSFMFDNVGNVKPFGIGEEKTIFSLGCLVVTMAVFSFYIFAIIDIVFSNKL
jgi:hypothetical protein